MKTRSKIGTVALAGLMLVASIKAEKPKNPSIFENIPVKTDTLNVEDQKDETSKKEEKSEENKEEKENKENKEEPKEEESYEMDPYLDNFDPDEITEDLLKEIIEDLRERGTI